MPGIFGFRVFFGYKPNLEHPVVAGEVNGQFEIILIQIDGPNEIPDDHTLEFRIPVIAVAHGFDVGSHAIPVNIKCVRLLDCDQPGQAILVGLEYFHALFDFIGHHSHLNRMDDVVDLLPGGLELLFIGGEFGFRVVFLRKLHQVVHDPGNRILVQHGLQNGAGDFLLDDILLDIRLFTGVLRPARLAGVVKIPGAEVAGAGVPHHRATAVTAEQLAGEQVIVIVMLPCPDDLVIVQFLFRHFKHAPFYDLRHTVVDSDIVIDINAGVSLVLQNRMEGILFPLLALLGEDVAPVQLVGNIDIRFIIQKSAEYLCDYPGSFIVQRVSAILPFLIPVWYGGHHFAFLCAVPEAAADVLGHVLGVELVHVHHGAQHEPACGIVAEFLFSVDHLHAGAGKALLVTESIGHVAADAVRFVGQKHLEFVPICGSEHPLKPRTIIPLAGYRAILISGDDGQILLPRIFLALSDLLLNAGVILHAGRISGIDRRGV